jgi:molybdenum cofactor biosynthesis enzyme MoaA
MFSPLAIESLPFHSCMQCDTIHECGKYQTCIIRRDGMTVETMQRQAAERERLKRVAAHAKEGRPTRYSKFEPE